MAKSTTSAKARKPSVDTPKVSKPHAGYPLFPHQSGRWAKKIRGRLHYFGRWGRKDGDRVVPVDNVEASAADALEAFNRDWPALSRGDTPQRADDNATDCTVAELSNAFLTMKKAKADRGALSLHSFSEYHRTCATLVGFFGGERSVASLRPRDFEALQESMAKGCNVVTLKSKINRARVVFKYAADNRLIERPVDYGQAFNRPMPKQLREARNEAGERLFSRDELLAILAALESDPVFRSMVLLGLNAGFGNNDVASLPKSAVDLERGWLSFPRPKTAVRRRVPLWPETVAALREAIPIRPAPVDAADAGLAFLTVRGTRFVRMQASKTTENRFVAINGLSRRFDGLLKVLEIDRRRGLGFYTLRHVFETVAGESRDQVAVDAIMGHVDDSMAGQYREGISDERLRAVVNTVRTWLWPDRAGKAKVARAKPAR